MARCVGTQVRVLKGLKEVLPEKGYTFVGRMPFQTIGDAKHRARRSDHNPDPTRSMPPGIVRAADIFLSRDELAGLAEAIRQDEAIVREVSDLRWSNVFVLQEG